MIIVAPKEQTRPDRREAEDPLPSVVLPPCEQPATERPDAFVCPISFELMEDPVMCSDGHTYERAAIQDWLRKNETSPKMNERLESAMLFPNHNLKAAIAEWSTTSIQRGGGVSLGAGRARMRWVPVLCRSIANAAALFS
jgi:hypothetical protein